MLGAEFFTDGDIEGWNNSGGLMLRPATLPSQIVHELAHVQQARKSPIAYLSNGSLLNWAIYEGTADFIASSITGAHTNEVAHIIAITLLISAPTGVIAQQNGIFANPERMEKRIQALSEFSVPLRVGAPIS